MLLNIFAAGAPVKQNMFGFHKTIKAPASDMQEMGVLNIDSDIYRNTGGTFSDIRICDSTRLEVPYFIRNKTYPDTVQNRYEVAMERVDFKTLPQNRIEIQFRCSAKDSFPCELAFVTPVRNFEKSVSVFGSDDRKSWEPLALDQPVFDYTQYIDARNVAVTFKKTHHSYYKLTINNVTETKRSSYTQIMNESGKGAFVKQHETFVQGQEVFRIDGVIFYGMSTDLRNRSDAHTGYPLTITRTSFDSSTRSTMIYCRSSREPLVSVSLSTTSNVFKRIVSVWGSNDTLSDSSWVFIATSELYRLKIREVNREQLGINFTNDVRYLRYRLGIADGDNQPLAITSVQATGIIKEIVFSAKKARELTVMYSTDSIDKPSYDLESVLSETPGIAYPVWQAGSQLQTGKKQNPVAPEKKKFDSKPLLVVSLFIMVIVLAGILFVTVKKVEKIK